MSRIKICMLLVLVAALASHIQAFTLGGLSSRRTMLMPSTRNSQLRLTPSSSSSSIIISSSSSGSSRGCSSSSSSSHHLSIITKKKYGMQPLSFKVGENDQSLDADIDIEEDYEDDDEEGGLSILRKLSNPLIVPLTASLGFAVSRSPVVALRIAGAAAGGALGFIARKLVLRKILEMEREISISGGDGGDNEGTGGGSAGNGFVLAPTVVSTLEVIRNGAVPAIQMSLASLEKLAKKHSVADEDLGALFTHVFSEVVYEGVTDAEDLMDLSKVIEYAKSMQLSLPEIGDGFALAASKIGRQLVRDDRGFFEGDYNPDMLVSSARMFFLGDKMVNGVGDGYYGKRLSIGLSFFLPETYKTIISDACTALFKKCVESVILNPGGFTQEEVAQLKDFLTTSASASLLRPANMENMIQSAITNKVTNALGADGAEEATIGDYAEYSQAQQILGWTERELEATLEVKTMPLFEQATKKLLFEGFEHPDRAAVLAERLNSRISDLNVDITKARVLLTTEVSLLNSEYMDKIDKVYNVSGGAIEPAFNIMRSYAASHEAFTAITKDVMEGTKLPLPGMPFATMVRVSMYEMQIMRGEADSGGVSEEILSLDDSQKNLVKKNLALPKVSGWIKQCIAEGNFDEKAAVAYSKQLDQFGVTKEEWQATAIDYYYQEARVIAQGKAVPTQADMERLSKLKTFLRIDNNTLVSQSNLELFGDKYVKALTEAMTPSGVITEEYVDGLSRLRQRLNLSEIQAGQLLALASRTRMGPIISDLANVWKSDTDATFRRDKEKKEKAAKKQFRDKSRDNIDSMDREFGFMEIGAQKEGGGPNVFMREALNLVDFFVENYGQQGLDRLLVEEGGATMPVTSVGIVPPEELAGMFKHYLVTRLSEQDPSLRARYQENEVVFGRVLGITVEGQQKMKESLAFTASRNMLRNVLQYKSKVEASDLQQYAFLKDSLGLDQETSDKIFDSSSLSAVMEFGRNLFRMQDSTGGMTAANARRFREQVASVGLDMRALSFSDALISFLYALEVQELIGSGQEAELADVQEAYDIDEEQAQVIIEVSCKRYISQLLILALRAAKTYDEKEATMYLRDIAKYAVFVNSPVDADGNLFDEKDKARLLSFWQATQDAEGVVATEGEVDMLAKLHDIINLTNDFVPPLQGFAGLLGNGESLAELERKMMSGEKSAWSWG